MGTTLHKRRYLYFGERLEAYVVATNSDGAAVMEKFVKLLPTIQKLRYNNAPPCCKKSVLRKKK
jgi:hypothetical protein